MRICDDDTDISQARGPAGPLFCCGRSRPEDCACAVPPTLSSPSERSGERGPCRALWIKIPDWLTPSGMTSFEGVVFHLDLFWWKPCFTKIGPDRKPTKRTAQQKLRLSTSLQAQLLLCAPFPCHSTARLHHNLHLPNLFRRAACFKFPRSRIAQD